MPAIAVRNSEQEVSSTEGRFYCPELDGVRFLAFISVFLHHLMPHSLADLDQIGTLRRIPFFLKTILVAAGNAFGFGLPLFFVLSAFLLGTLLLKEKDRSGTVNLRAFYLRRILRIWPLYFFALFSGSCIALFVERRPEEIVLFASFALLIGNWFLMRFQSSNPMSPLWSISIEEQFYLFCPIVVRSFSRRSLYVFSFALIVLSDIVLYCLGEKHADCDRTVWFNSLVQFQMFSVGLLLCLASGERKNGISFWKRPIYLMAGVTCWFVAVYVYGAKQLMPAISGLSLIAGYSLGAVGCLLIMKGMLGLDAQWLPGWVIRSGRISFGLYVFHQLAIHIGFHLFAGHGVGHWLKAVVVAVTVTFSLAYLSYRFLETPFLRLKHRFEVVPSRPD